MSESAKKIKSERKMLKLQEDEYQSEMSLYDDNCIEFKVALNSPMATCYYMEKYDLETIKEISFLYHKKFNNIEVVYQYYKDRVFAEKEMNLVLSPDKNVMSLMYKKIVDDETTPVELKLKKKILKKDDIVQALMKEVEQLKKTVIEQEKKNEELKKYVDLLMEENKKAKEKEKKEEKRKNEDEKNEENWKIEEENFSSMNDNVNLTNNFKFENFPELKYIESISCGKSDCNKNVAVYCIIKNDERLYQMAYCKNKNYSNYNYSGHIIIYNLMLNKIENKIYNAHGNTYINKLKHYYNSSAKNHILLSSCSSNNSYCTKLWNISSNPIINILKVKDCYNPCLMFKNEDFFIFGNHYEETNNNEDKRMCVWNKNGAFIKKMNKSNLNSNLGFIEATYLENKNYILSSGCNYDQNKRECKYFSECYNFDEDDVKTYKDDENNSETYTYCINLFKKGNVIYFITGCKEKVNIFEFESTKFIKRIQLGEKEVYSLCSINEKYVIASNASKLKIIDMEKYSIVKDYSACEDDGFSHIIYGIKKIKIPEKGEFIITYTEENIIRIWKM